MLELGASWLVQAVGLFVAALCIRLSMCLPAYKSRRWTHVKGCARTLLVFGSGGHTTEMLMLVEKLPRDRFGPVDCVLAQSDKTTMAKVEASRIDSLQSCTWHTVFRSREVKQGWASTLLTSLYALLQSFLLVLRTRPRLIICNGPGTCVPICYAAFLYNLLGVTCTQIVFVESFCRVQKLSLTGRLLYYIADRFVVQWQQLADKHPRAEMLGQL
ncbi:oligosaccharide biosynthesis protein Alg14 like-domain-containing protein [Ochromonadaceae sp. CCMP2298]|nr:oligosaccharide biosynthesis protein Alg14 like-domain-containing protein [Ochromonadaceae sp. CCMP2298]